MHDLGVLVALACGLVYMVFSFLKCFIGPGACINSLYWKYGAIIIVLGTVQVNGLTVSPWNPTLFLPIFRQYNLRKPEAHPGA